MPVLVVVEEEEKEVRTNVSCLSSVVPRGRSAGRGRRLRRRRRRRG